MRLETADLKDTRRGDSFPALKLSLRGSHRKLELPITHVAFSVQSVVARNWQAENGGVVDFSATMEFSDVANSNHKAQMILPRIFLTIALSTLQDILHLRLMGWSG